jgi:hypothetical protein
MFYKYLAKAILVTACGFSGVSAAQDWINVGPIESRDMSAFVDYQVQSSVPNGDVWGDGPAQGPESYQHEANPIWVNINRTNLTESDQVFVQIISYERSCYRGFCGSAQHIVERDLEFAENGRFTGQMQPLTLSYQLNDGYAVSSLQSYRTELVVWINGELYKGDDGRNLRFPMPVQ